MFRNKKMLLLAASVAAAPLFQLGCGSGLWRELFFWTTNITALVAGWDQVGVV